MAFMKQPEMADLSNKRNRGSIRRLGSEKIPKAHILLTIVFTSFIWLLLDLFLFATQDMVGFKNGPDKFPVLDDNSDVLSYDIKNHRPIIKQHFSDHHGEDGLREMEIESENTRKRRANKLREWRGSLDGRARRVSETQGETLQVEHVDALKNRIVNDESNDRPQSFHELHAGTAVPQGKPDFKDKRRRILPLERDNSVHERIIEDKSEERPKSIDEIQNGALLSRVTQSEITSDFRVEKKVPDSAQMEGNVIQVKEKQENVLNIDEPNLLNGEVQINSSRVRENGTVSVTKQGRSSSQTNMSLPFKIHKGQSATLLPLLYFEKVRDLDVTNMPRVSSMPGEGGRAVILSAMEQIIAKQLWNKNHFNVFASDKISLERSIPDPRPAECKLQQFPYKHLPKTSIIMCFTDEAWSTLLRSVHSVLNRSPPELVEEVILVDDFSQKEHLKEKLDEYISHYPKVKVLRLAKREGLIRARLAAVEIAKGEVVTFLDSHIECTVGWLEPLLERIRLNPRAVPCPVIDGIADNTFAYGPATAAVRGGFNWHALMFKWIPVPQYEKDRLNDTTDAVRSPTMAGGLFSIKKDFFYQLGTYDPGLQIWGGENIELSFKVWLCGGSLEILPCSHVGHVFRSKQPYSFPGGDNISVFIRNSLRVATVWLDEYIEAFFNVQPQFRNIDIGNVTDRLNFKRSLSCKNFGWYLKNVYPEQPIPGFKLKALGEVFRFTEENRIEVGDQCLVRFSNAVIQPLPCERAAADAIWEHLPGGYIKHSKTGLCLDLLNNQRDIVLINCLGTETQKWSFSEYKGLS